MVYCAFRVKLRASSTAVLLLHFMLRRHWVASLEEHNFDRKRYCRACADPEGGAAW